MNRVFHFNDIYTSYYRRSFLFVKSYIKDSMAAEDIVSEALIDLWNVCKKESVEHPLSLLLTMLRNKSLNYLKHQRIHQASIASLRSQRVRDVEYSIMALQACNPSDLFSSEIIGIIRDTLGQLPEQTRHIFEMSRYDGLTAKEIADELGISVKGVEYHITKSLKALRVALGEYLPAVYLVFLL